MGVGRAGLLTPPAKGLRESLPAKQEKRQEKPAGSVADRRGGRGDYRRYVRHDPKVVSRREDYLLPAKALGKKPMHPAKVFQALKRQFRARNEESVLRYVTWYEENGKLCLEVRRNTFAAHLLNTECFRNYLKDFSQRTGNEVFLKVT